MKSWFEIFSEFFVNLSVVWFALVFIEPQVAGLKPETLNTLIVRFALGVVSLTIAKNFREEARKI